MDITVTQSEPTDEQLLAQMEAQFRQMRNGIERHRAHRATNRSRPRYLYHPHGKRAS